MPSLAALGDLFSEWQSDLRLNDWNIRWALRSSLELGTDHGRVRVHELKMCAFISLLDPADTDPDEIEPYDIEIAMVHELLHVRHYSLFFDKGTPEDLCIESAIHVLSNLLVEMKRRTRELERTRRPRKKQC